MLGFVDAYDGIELIVVILIEISAFFLLLYFNVHLFNRILKHVLHTTFIFNTFHELRVVHLFVLERRLYARVEIVCVQLYTVQIDFTIVKIWINQQLVWFLERSVGDDVSKLVASDGVQRCVGPDFPLRLEVKDVEIVVEYFVLLQVLVVGRKDEVVPNLDDIIVVIHVAIGKRVQSRLQSSDQWWEVNRCLVNNMLQCERK